VEANTVLERFAPQLRWVVDSIMSSFELEPHFKDDVKQEGQILLMSYGSLFDEPQWGDGRLAKFEIQANGDESQVKALIGRQLRIDLSQVTSRMIHRNGDESMHDSLDRIQDEYELEPQSGPGETFNVATPPADPTVDYEDVMVTLADPGTRYLRRFVKEYPFLAMQVIGEMSIDDIRKKAGVSRRTAMYRLSAERAVLEPLWDYEGSLFGDWLKTLTRSELEKIRRDGLYDYLVLEVCEKITDNGRVDLLCVEGDEDLEDLVEAKTNLFAVGR
jgi:hypothetical protein